MTRTQVRTQVGLILDRLGVSDVDDSRRIATLGLSSLQLVELTLYVEDEFSLDVPESVIEQLPTVGSLVEYVTLQVGAA